jgi:hypothetical protein
MNPSQSIFNENQVIRTRMQINPLVYTSGPVKIVPIPNHIGPPPKIVPIPNHIGPPPKIVPIPNHIGPPPKIVPF